MSKNKKIKNEEELEKKEQNFSEEKKVESAEENKDTNKQEETELSIEEQLTAAKEEITKLKDQNLRQLAEFDNYRKRTLKEKADLILNGGEKTISSLLPVLDDLERALSNIEKSQDFETLKEGVELISKKLLSTLESQGLKTIETNDADFNTDFHEAVALIDAPQKEQKGKIIDCVQKGYKLNEKVIRHSKVVVGK